MQGRSWVGVAIVTQRLAQLLRSHGSPKVERATAMADRAAILQLPAVRRPWRPASGGAAVAAGNGVVHAAVRARPSCTPFIRCSAMAKWAGSRSMPMAWKPSPMAALIVVPLPMNGSSTTPPGGVTRRQR